MIALSRRAALVGIGALLCMLPVLTPVQAQEPLRIIYPYPAGGSGDAIARMFAEHLKIALNRPVVVENKTGAGGLIGVQTAKDAPPDGNTLLFTATGQLAIQPHTTSNAGYDPFVDFVPISDVARTEVALAVGGQLPVRSLVELKDWLKANPDKATFASPGAATAAHFAGMEFARAYGLSLNHVAYRGAPAALPDLIAGRVSMLFAISAELMEHHKSGSIRILAVASDLRTPFLPDVPTFAESGVDVVAPTGFSFYAHSRTAPAFVDRFEKAIGTISQLQEIKTKILALGLQHTGTTGTELARHLRTQSDRWAAVVKASGFKPE
jgi:tripartite-type tricarboxylate transporter receptor subunit TctC